VPLIALVAMVALLMFPVSAAVRERPLLPAPSGAGAVTLPGGATPAETVATGAVAGGAAAAHVRPVPRSVVVVPGDSLWAIAERMLGDPLRWREIWARNRGHVMPAGARFTDANLIEPGWRLVVF
jgi:nucleoid-associated protein YgaU